MKISAVQEFFLDEDDKTVFGGPANTVDWFRTIHFASSFEKDRLTRSAKLGYLANCPLSTGSLTELQTIAWRLNVQIPTFLEWKCWLEKNQMRLHVPGFVLISFVYDHPVCTRDKRIKKDIALFLSLGQVEWQLVYIKRSIREFDLSSRSHGDLNSFKRVIMEWI